MDLEGIRAKMKARRTVRESADVKKWVIIFDQETPAIVTACVNDSELKRLCSEIGDKCSVVASYNSQDNRDKYFESDTEELVSDMVMTEAQLIDIAGIETQFYCLVTPDANELQDNSENATLDLSYSQGIYDHYVNNLSSMFDYNVYEIKEKTDSIINASEKSGISDYEKDRLLFLAAVLRYFYFSSKYLEDDFDDNDSEYYSLLDSIDDIIRNMSEITGEAYFLYNVANMYSADRFNDVDPLDKLNELKQTADSIELDPELCEWKVSFWKEESDKVYDIMHTILTADDNEKAGNQDLSWVDNVVFEVISSVLNVDLEDIEYDSRLTSDLGADSLDAVEIILELEKRFDITIPDEEAERIRTVGDICSYIRCHI